MKWIVVIADESVVPKKAAHDNPDPCEGRVVANDRYYKNVHSVLKDELFRFREECRPKTIALGGVTWEYYAAGNAEPTLMLLPGGLGVAEAWFHCMLQWSKEHRVIAVSYPAVGSVRQVITAVQTILEHEGVRQAALLGTSLGGYIVQAVIRDRPGLLRYAILGNTGAESPAHYEKLKKQYPIVKLFLNRYAFAFLKFAAKRRVAKLLAGLDGSERAFWVAYVEDLIDNQYSPANLQTQFAVSLDFAAQYGSEAPAGIIPKVLIIEAQDDQMISRDRREKLKRLFPTAQIKTFPHGGHLPAITRAEEYVTTVSRFLKSP